MADLEKMGARDERTRTPRKMGRLSAEQAEAIKAKIAAGEAGQYEAAILWQELERLGSAGQGEPPKHKFRPTNGNIYRCAICGSCQCDGTAPAEKEG